MIKKGTPDFFWSRVDVLGEDDCWQWKGPTDKQDRYGEVWYQHKRHIPRRLAYILMHGEPPPGQQVSSYCANPTCCNPKHLYAGTRKQIIMNSRIYGEFSLHQERRVRKFSRFMRRIDTYNKIFELRAQGMSFGKIGEAVGYTLSGISRIVNGNRSAWLAPRKEG